MLHMQIKLVRTSEHAHAALTHIGMCDKIAVGCEGDMTIAGQMCMIQVLFSR